MLGTDRWTFKVHNKGPFLSTDGQTNRLSGPITRPASTNMTQVKSSFGRCQIALKHFVVDVAFTLFDDDSLQ